MVSDNLFLSWSSPIAFSASDHTTGRPKYFWVWNPVIRPLLLVAITQGKPRLSSLLPLSGFCLTFLRPASFIFPPPTNRLKNNSLPTFSGFGSTRRLLDGPGTRPSFARRKAAISQADLLIRVETSRDIARTQTVLWQSWSMSRSRLARRSSKLYHAAPQHSDSTPVQPVQRSAISTLCLPHVPLTGAPIEFAQPIAHIFRSHR